MKNTTKLLAASLLTMTLLQGCSMNNDDMDGKENQTNETSPVKNAENAVDDSIDNMMSYFDEKKVQMENMQPIKNMEFAAKEGRSFMIDGKNAYLYRVKSDDESMKKVMKEAKDKGKVKVNIDNKEMEYGARVNGDYLLLYDTNANMNDVLTTFDGYTMANKTNTSSAKEAADNNPSTNTGNVQNSNGTTKNPSDNATTENNTNNMTAED